MRGAPRNELVVVRDPGALDQRRARVGPLPGAGPHPVERVPAGCVRRPAVGRGEAVLRLEERPELAHGGAGGVDHLVRRQCRFLKSLECEDPYASDKIEMPPPRLTNDT